MFCTRLLQLAWTRHLLEIGKVLQHSSRDRASKYLAEYAWSDFPRANLSLVFFEVGPGSGRI